MGTELVDVGLVVLDVAEAPPDAVRRLPFTTWLRLQRMVEGSQTAAVLVGSAPMARSSAGVSIRLQRATAGAAATVSSTHARFSGALFEGLSIEAGVSRARVQPVDSSAIALTTRAAHHV